MPLECDINIAINGSFWVEVANPEQPFTAILISCSRGTCLIMERSLIKGITGIKWKSCLHMLCVGALEEDAQSQDPLLAVDVAVVVGVEALEHAVQQDVVRHVEGVVQELSADDSCS